MPVFFIQDGIKFPDLVQADKDKQVAKLKPAKARTSKSSTAKGRAKSTSRTAARKAS